MARIAKKENTLTLEEKLSQALVPEAEQPYQVPKNWCWTRLSYLLTPSKETTEDFSDSSIKYIGLENIEKNIGITSYSTSIGIKSLKNVFSSGQILYGKLRPYLNKHAIANFDGICSTDILVFETKRIVLKEYVNYYFNLPDFIEYAVANSKGINLPRVSESAILNAQIPFPPLAEQKCIVDRIESLFAKLDEAKSKAQAVIDGFEDRKTVILHKAFTGELTKEWRNTNGVSVDTWHEKSLKECCSIGSGGTPSRNNPEFYNGSIPWIKTGEINWNELYDAEEHISESALENSSAKLYPEGAVLVAMYGMGVTRGRAAILKVKAATNQAVCVLLPKDYLLNRFLFYFFMCNYSDIRDQAVGGNQLNLSGAIISKFKIKIPAIDEQNEIVRVLDSLLQKEQETREFVEQVIEQIDSMRKTILSWAFHGKLSTCNSSDESAIELLRQIWAEENENITYKRSFKRNISRINIMGQQKKTILEILTEQKKMTPEKLKTETGLDADDFYSELKVLVDASKVKETRDGLDVFLEVE